MQVVPYNKFVYLLNNSLCAEYVGKVDSNELWVGGLAIKSRIRYRLSLQVFRGFLQSLQATRLMVPEIIP